MSEKRDIRTVLYLSWLGAAGECVTPGSILDIFQLTARHVAAIIIYFIFSRSTYVPEGQRTDLVVVRSAAVLLVVLVKRLLLDHVLVLDDLVCNQRSQPKRDAKENNKAAVE